MSLKTAFSETLTRLGITVPEFLLPGAGTDLAKWAVVACDQYTSDHAYWKRVEAAVGEAPSTLRLTLPEIFLESPDVPERIADIHAAMADYQAKGLLEGREGFVYIRRTTEHSGTREGLLVAMDLERYDYSKDSKSLIRATEGTIVERIPPRLAVRRAAPLELPHIMILVDDPERSVIEGLAARTDAFEPAYDVELMENGGRLQGWVVASEAEVGRLLGQFEGLMARTIASQGSEPLFWAMGDGNHSLATAKARWEETKTELRESGESEDSIMAHPARFALAEIVNIHSPGLLFEPIHRAVFTDDLPELTETVLAEPTAEITQILEADLQKLLVSPEGQNKAGYFDGKNWYVLSYRGKKLPTAKVDDLFSRFLRARPGSRIDFIHGWEDTRKLVSEGAGVFFTPVIGRDRLFTWVQENGPLPKKSFSMGHAEEKRYYMEARRIVR